MTQLFGLQHRRGTEKMDYFLLVGIPDLVQFSLVQADLPLGSAAFSRRV